MDPGEQTTGTRDEHYNLISVLYHALHGSETTEAYTLDAEAAGDERLAAFFREAQATQRQLAERAKGMLGIREAAPRAGGISEGEVPPRTVRSGWETPPPSPRRESSGGVLPEGGATSDTAPGDVPPRPAEAQREPNIPADETGMTAEEALPMMDVPPAPPTTVPLPDEDLVAEMEGVVPEDEREASPEGTTREAPPAGREESVEEA
jgi:hypothetical protein